MANSRTRQATDVTVDMARVHEFMQRETDAMEAELIYSITYEQQILSWFMRSLGDDTPPLEPPPDKAEYVNTYVAEKIELRRLDREVGPILGPGRQEWRTARRPFERNRAIRNTMPGRHPLEFVPAHRITAPGR